MHIVLELISVFQKNGFLIKKKGSIVIKNLDSKI